MFNSIENYKILAQHFSLLPIHRNSKAAAHKNWQKQCHTKVPFNSQHFLDQQGQVMNAGIACGPANGVIIVDIDDLILFQQWCEKYNIANPTPSTFTVTSGGKSNHYYYKYPIDGNEYKKCKVPGVDLLGVGSYALAPGSIHPKTGNQYFISCDQSISPAPQWVLDAMLGKIPRKLIQKTTIQVENRQQAPVVTATDNNVYKGGRNDYLTSVAGSLHGKGLSPEAVKAALFQENASICNPPLDTDEVEKIYNSISNYPQSMSMILTHQGFADVFVKEHSDRVKYNFDTGEWYIWAGKYWQTDKSGEIYSLMKDFIRRTYQHGCTIPGEYGKALKKKSREYENGNNFDQILIKAKADPTIAVSSNIFDNDPSKLNCSNGTIDLKAGTLMPHNPLDFNSKMISTEYDPNAQAPVFKRFVDSIMEGKKELIEYLNKAAGYAATGETKEQCYFLMYGFGSNGKTTLMNALKKILSPFSADISFKSLINHNDRARQDLAKTVGVRLLTSSEVDPDKAMDETIINRITGNETFTAKCLYQNPFDFTPQFKLFIVGNQKPKLQSFNHATRRRIRVIPFNKCFKGKELNNNLPDELRKEYPGILRWIVEGAVEYYRSGLETPDILKDEIKEYIEEIDTISNFLESEFEWDIPNASFPCAEFNKRYKQWCKDNGKESIGTQTITRTLNEKGFIKKKKGKEVWLGLRLKGRGVCDPTVKTVQNPSRSGRTLITAPRQAVKVESMPLEVLNKRQM